MNKNKCGPQNLPTEWTPDIVIEKQVVELYCIKIWEHMLKKTNEKLRTYQSKKMKENNIPPGYKLSKKCNILQLTLTDIKNYWCVYWSIRINSVANK